MEDDIICITDRIEIHPGVNRHTGDRNDTYCVVRDGMVSSTHTTLELARAYAEELATGEDK